MSWPDYVRRIPPETYTNILYSAAQLGAVHAAAMATNLRGGWTQGDRKRQRIYAGSGAGSFAPVGGDPQGPGVVRTTNSKVNNYIQDPSLVRLNKRGARWVDQYYDRRPLLHRLIWPRHLVQRTKDLPTMTATGSTALSQIQEVILWDNDTTKAIAMTANALANNDGTPPLNVGGILPVGNQEAVSETDATALLNSAGKIEMAVCNDRMRLRNTSNRNARLRMYEFTCKRSCNPIQTPLQLWTDALTQDAVAAGTVTDAAAVATLTEDGTWQPAMTNMLLPETPFAKPKGYGQYWRKSNEFTVDLKPGKQIVYTTNCEAKRVDLKRLNINIEDHGVTGNLAGVTKVIMFILIGDCITDTGAADASKIGNYGFADTVLQVMQEDQFCTSLVWAQRTKKIFLSRAADGHAAGNYWHGIAQNQQAGTASGVSAGQAGFTANLN